MTCPTILTTILFLGTLCLFSCESTKDPEPGPDTVTAYDGNVYPVVKIFDKLWMAENLKTTRLNNGKTITMVSDDWNWDFLDEPKWCFYNNDGPANRDVYGKLYNYYAVSSGKLCPAGWHVPDKEEWGTLIGYLGGYNVAGGKLKEPGTTHWESPNTGADNSSGFGALPGGYRTNEGVFRQMGYNGLWWCSGSTSPFQAVQATSTGSSVSWMYVDKYYGISVRCVKDN